MFGWLQKFIPLDPPEGIFRPLEGRIEASQCTDEFLAHIYRRNVPGWIAIGGTGVLIEWKQIEWLVTFEGTLPPTNIMERHLIDVAATELYRRESMLKVHCRTHVSVRSCFLGLYDTYAMAIPG